MKRIVATIFAVALAAPAFAGGSHHKQPPPPAPTPPPVVVPPPAPTPAPQKSGGGDSLLLPVLIAAGIATIVIYSKVNEKSERRVSLQPTPDGKGATASVEFRF